MVPEVRDDGIEKIREIIRYALKHGYEKSNQRFKISAKKLREYFSNLEDYYRTRDYSRTSESKFEELFWKYTELLIKSDSAPETEDSHQKVWWLELKAIAEESRRRGTYHHIVVERFIERRRKGK